MGAGTQPAPGAGGAPPPISPVLALGNFGGRAAGIGVPGQDDAVTAYCRASNIDQRAEMCLRSLPVHLAAEVPIPKNPNLELPIQVMQQGPILGANASAILMVNPADLITAQLSGDPVQLFIIQGHGRFARPEGGVLGAGARHSCPPPRSGTGDASREANRPWIQNGIDMAAARSLRALSPNQQHEVMNDGSLQGMNPSALLMSRIRRVQGLPSESRKGAPALWKDSSDLHMGATPPPLRVAPGMDATAQELGHGRYPTSSVIPGCYKDHLGSPTQGKLWRPDFGVDPGGEKAYPEDQPPPRRRHTADVLHEPADGGDGGWRRHSASATEAAAPHPGPAGRPAGAAAASPWATAAPERGVSIAEHFGVLFDPFGALRRYTPIPVVGTALAVVAFVRSFVTPDLRADVPIAEPRAPVTMGCCQPAGGCQSCPFSEDEEPVSTVQSGGGRVGLGWSGRQSATDASSAVALPLERWTPLPRSFVFLGLGLEGAARLFLALQALYGLAVATVHAPCCWCSGVYPPGAAPTWATPKSAYHDLHDLQWGLAFPRRRRWDGSLLSSTGVDDRSDPLLVAEVMVGCSLVLCPLAMQVVLLRRCRRRDGRPRLVEYAWLLLTMLQVSASTALNLVKVGTVCSPMEGTGSDGGPRGAPAQLSEVPQLSGDCGTLSVWLFQWTLIVTVLSSFGLLTCWSYVNVRLEDATRGYSRLSTSPG
ncbi:unnamed protein product [Prorocentrum cordatum]|uniref:Uncharacterized protein n=1 Tax=Prorocentrum cordatum TaxID=2364126 RepID=A0ABN9PT84_9DINO|nr:unnamed protein product [Polarella glacialis]